MRVSSLLVLSSLVRGASSSNVSGRHLWSSSSCLGSTDVLNFETIGECSDDRILQAIEDALTTISHCENDVSEEARGLTGAFSDSYALYMLRDICETLQPPCTTIEDLGFPDIVACTYQRVLDALRGALQGTSCPHDASEEAKLLTGERYSWSAMSQLEDICDDQIEYNSCTTIEALDFRSIEKCSYFTIRSRINDIIGTECSHDADDEAMLLTGLDYSSQALRQLEEMCASEVGCTSMDDFDSCDFQSIMDTIEFEVRFNCPHDETTELKILTGTDSFEEAKQYIGDMCNEAWSKVGKRSFVDIDPRFNNVFMGEYSKGGTFLNTETGNFRGRDNPAYPTSDESRTAGQAINDFYRNDAKSTILQAPLPDLQNCQLQAMMCCFGRDRQSNDNNGNCRNGDCADSDPGDNSNLCFTGPSNTAFPGESEGDIHCHGFAWGKDDNDYTSQLKYNNLFYVAMYDHLYSRGYVEKAVKNADDIPMCGCIEDMPPVSRADCTQVDESFFGTFSFSRNSDGLLQVSDDDANLSVRFNACRGQDIDFGFPENNDLASHAVKLANEGRMSTETRDGIFDVLVGFADPDDDENEAVCAITYEETTGQTYPRGGN